MASPCIKTKEPLTPGTAPSFLVQPTLAKSPETPQSNKSSDHEFELPLKYPRLPPLLKSAVYETLGGFEKVGCTICMGATKVLLD